jgi:hypothetical protein
LDSKKNPSGIPIEHRDSTSKEFTFEFKEEFHRKPLWNLGMIPLGMPIKFL